MADFWKKLLSKARISRSAYISGAILSLSSSLFQSNITFIRRFGRDASRTMRKSCVMRVIKCVDHHRTGKSWRTRVPSPGLDPDSRQKERKKREGASRTRFDKNIKDRRDPSSSRGRRDVSHLYRSYIKIRRRDERCYFHKIGFAIWLRFRYQPARFSTCLW